MPISGLELDQARQLLQSNNSSVLSIPEIATSPLITPLRLEQSELMRRDAELRAKFGERYAGVLALDVQLAGINKSLYEELVRSVAQLQSDFDLALRRERLLEASLQQLTARQSDSGDTVKLQQLQRIADADSKLYETYLSQYNEVGTRLSLQMVGAKIISPAELPTVPAFPRHQTLIYIGAVIFGLAGGIFLALMLEYMRPRVSSSLQVQRMFGHVVVGALPLMHEPGRRDSSHITLVNTVRTAPLSPFSEAVRAIRIALRLADRDHAPTVVLVTSCLPGEGKSAVASLLAASSTAAQLRTILVDCDLRGRAVSRNLGKKSPGLGELLSGIGNLEDVTVRDTAIGWVLPAGTSSGGPSDLLSSKKMGEIIDRLRRDFDYIVLEHAAAALRNRCSGAGVRGRQDLVDDRHWSNPSRQHCASVSAANAGERADCGRGVQQDPATSASKISFCWLLPGIGEHRTSAVGIFNPHRPFRTAATMGPQHAQDRTQHTEAISRVDMDFRKQTFSI